MYLPLKNSDELLCANAYYTFSILVNYLSRKNTFLCSFPCDCVESAIFLIFMQTICLSLYIDFLTYCVFDFQLKIWSKQKRNWRVKVRVTNFFLYSCFWKLILATVKPTPSLDLYMMWTCNVTRLKPVIEIIVIWRKIKGQFAKQKGSLALDMSKGPFTLNVSVKAESTLQWR